VRASVASRALGCALMAAFALVGCRALHDLGEEPRLTPMTIVVPLPSPVPEDDRVLVTPIHQNSTWRDRSADFFRDSRAMRRGDILTVKISIRDKASLDSSANRSRDSKLASQGNLKFGLNAFGLKESGDGSLDAGTGSKTSSEGRGAISRSEQIDLLVAATIIEILPSGNLVVRGNQEVRVNFEKRVLSVEGIVRPRDIATDNSISYDKIAEARVSYGGEGGSTNMLQPPLGQQIVDRVSPF
jgi:flagellar L-ring protein FlgH